MSNISDSEPRALELFLLNEMRNTERVRMALTELGCTLEQLLATAQAVRACGVGTLGHRIDAYGGLVESVVPERMESRDPYAQLVWAYRLRMWPDFDFCLGTNLQGVVGPMEFRRRGARATGLALEDVKPWHAVELDLPEIEDASLDVVEYWPPLRDYLVRAQGRCVYLQFDYGLLQNVRECDSLAGT